MFQSFEKACAGGTAAPNMAFVRDAPPIGSSPHNSALWASFQWVGVHSTENPHVHQVLL